MARALVRRRRTGRDSSRERCGGARRLLIRVRISDWHYRVALRRAFSGVARAPKVIELDRRYVTGKPAATKSPGTC